jgi:hypothetical protein
MRAMRRLLQGLAALAVLGFFATFLMEATFQGRSTRVQLVRHDSGARLATVGTPFDAVDVPREAIVEPARDGLAALVDAKKLAASGPTLRLDTVQRFAWLARIGCVLAAGCLLLGIRISDRLGLPPDLSEG